MLAKANLISCNFLGLSNNPYFRNSLHTTHLTLLSNTYAANAIPSPSSSTTLHLRSKPQLSLSFQRKRILQVRRSTPLNQQDSNIEIQVAGNGNGNGNGNGGGDGRDWTTSIMLSLLWIALIYYVYVLSPNQTPSRDVYFLKKLLNLKGDDGFRMNEVLVSLWYIMGLWPLAYSMLLVPTGRSSKSKIPVWPFLVLSCFGGAYALLPYFVLWKPPAPPVEENQLKTWPLTILDSKVTAVILLAAGVAIVTYAGLAGADTWKEFYQYFRESKFIHIMSIDFALLSAFAPFWVYNDMTARKWFDNGSWLLPISLIPFLGPGLYLLLRPSLSTIAISQTPSKPE